MRFNDLDIYNKKIRNKIITNFKKVIQKNNFIFSEDVILLEKKLAKNTENRFCITTGSGTDSISLSLMSLRLRRGDEIIIPAFSWLSVAECVLLLGLKPVYADVDLDTYNIDIKSIKKNITSKTRAIISTSLFGRSAELIEIKKICRMKKIYFIEDAAQNFGSYLKGANALSIADITCTSFFPTKNLGCFGDGGAIFTNNKKFFTRLISLRNHGQTKYSNSRYIGLNSRLGTVQAKILLEKLKGVKYKINNQKIVYKSYEEFFKKNNIVGFPKMRKDDAVSQFSILVKNRISLINFFKKNKIPFKLYYPKPLYKQFNQKIKKKCFNTEKICKSIISLPFNDLKKNRHMKVLNFLKILIKKNMKIFFEKKN